MEKLKVEALGLRGALASNERELAKKDSRLADLDSLKEQLANSENTAEALKIAKEEACKATEDRLAEIDKLKEDHNFSISWLDGTHAAEVS